jgi:micrococcal nuclease
VRAGYSARVSKPWNPDGASGTRWLSDAEYRALSPQERRALHFKRALARHERRYQPKPAGYRKGYFPRQRYAWLATTMVLGLLATKIYFIFSHFGPHVSARPAVSAPVTATLRQSSGQAFGYCQWGGGTNCVVDGDTFWIGGEKVRIAGIDAPETHPSRCEYEARLGNAATDKLHDLLNSGAVTMTSIDRDRDAYGRLLRNVAVNGVDVGEAMISAGVAREYGSGRRPWC